MKVGVSKLKFSLNRAGMALAAALVASTAIGGVWAISQDAAVAATAAEDAIAPGQVVGVRRISEDQYRHTLDDLFFEGIELRGRFEPEVRSHGLFAIGAREASVSALGFQQYFAIARYVADQVFEEEHRAGIMPCQPADVTRADDACTEAFVRHYGRYLFRRPMTDAEVAPRVQLAAESTEGDYYEGVKMALVSMLASPEFLFRYETAVQQDGEWTLDGYTRAARLSYLYWDTAPDEELLRAAETGVLMTPEGIEAQVARLESSPRIEEGLRALFSDMLRFEMLDERPKNPDIYPKFSQLMVESAREQTLRTISNHLLRDDGDYRDLMTTRDTEINRIIAAVYKVPYTFGEEWVPYTFKEDEGRAGIQTQILFLSQFSHPGRSSPTLRGVGVNEVLLCEETPLPPPNVDFSIINDTANPLLRTVRARLLAHATDDTCAGCHNLTDPIGLAMEHFDGLGQPRKYENGQLIDVTAEIDGVPFDGAIELASVMRENPRVPACLVRRVFEYGAGRTPTIDEEYDTILPEQEELFAEDGYRYRGLVHRIATAPEFYDVVLPEGEELEADPSEVANRPSQGAFTIGGL